MRYALFAARAQIYRRIDDICNDIKPGLSEPNYLCCPFPAQEESKLWKNLDKNLDLVQKDVKSNRTSTLLEVIITKMMSQRDILEDLLIQIRELLDLVSFVHFLHLQPKESYHCLLGFTRTESQLVTFQLESRDPWTSQLKYKFSNVSINGVQNFGTKISTQTVIIQTNMNHHVIRNQFLFNFLLRLKIVT